MQNTEGQPKFPSRVPEHLLKDLDDGTRWQYHQLDQQTQHLECLSREQMEIKSRLVSGDKRFEEHAHEISLLKNAQRDLEPVRRVIVSRWKILGVFCGTILAPLGVGVLIEKVKDWIK